MKESIKLARIGLIALVSCLSPSVNAVELPAAPFSRLGSAEFAERERGQKELLEWCRKQPGPAMDELFRHSRVAKDPEVRERCMAILRDLVTDDYLKEGQGYIGVALMDDLVNVPGDPKPRNAIRISMVELGSPGAKAGIKVNDLILALDGKMGAEVQGYLKFQEEIRSRKPNTLAKLNILRDGEMLEIEVRLGRRLPTPENFFPDGRNADPEALDRAAKDAHFRRWVEKKKLGE